MPVTATSPKWLGSKATAIPHDVHPLVGWPNAMRFVVWLGDSSKLEFGSMLIEALMSQAHCGSCVGASTKPNPSPNGHPWTQMERDMGDAAGSIHILPFFSRYNPTHKGSLYPPSLLGLNL
eukprot:1161958-Pelagomonas_calceolata.AAC.9